ncbi:MAG: gamma carbonic anhydrase family protein [Flavobacteriales bacterium]
MAIVKTVNDLSPKLGEGTWLAETAVIIGDVVLGKNCSVWYNAIIRGDVNAIRIGDRTNIQDGAVVHCTYKKAATTIGSEVSIGHNAIVHGCTLEDNCMVGMGAIVMDKCVVESGAVVAAGALIPEGTTVKSGWIYAGVPAKPLKEIPDSIKKALLENTPKNYVMYKGWFEDNGF